MEELKFFVGRSIVAGLMGGCTEEPVNEDKR
jgi:hypothetical protein